ncbi:MAG: LLM class flavin-dependent oxidoreductase [Gammaproteobacteria bacterium]|nr:LLM class flavin-dependent oxidoreductase [Gammaproteobacteria bacterium]
MHVGCSPIFQNPGNQRSDAEVYREELRLIENAEPLGFDSVWSIEHHFTDYTMCPDAVQFLTYMAGRSKRLKLGTSVIVLPWHDPMRVAEQISMLDHLSGGRMILGLGRGLARVEYDGFRIDQGEGRERFVEYAELLLEGLERGYVEGGALTKQPRRDIRPLPLNSFKGRTYAAAVSPESMPIMAKLGVGLLVIPQKPWEVVKQDFAIYREVFQKSNGCEPPQPFCGGFYFVDKDPARAEDMAYQWIGAYYHTAMKHYEMTGAKFGTDKGYEFYKNVGKYIGKQGMDGAARSFAELMPWGSPKQVLEKIAYMREVVDMNGITCNFSYAGMPYDEAERNMRCFAEYVLPELKKWETTPLADPKLLNLRAA